MQLRAHSPKPGGAIIYIHTCTHTHAKYTLEHTHAHNHTRERERALRVESSAPTPSHETRAPRHRQGCWWVRGSGRGVRSGRVGGLSGSHGGDAASPRWLGRAGRLRMPEPGAASRAPGAPARPPARRDSGLAASAEGLRALWPTGPGEDRVRPLSSRTPSRVRAWLSPTALSAEIQPAVAPKAQTWPSARPPASAGPGKQGALPREPRAAA